MKLQSKLANSGVSTQGLFDPCMCYGCTGCDGCTAACGGGCMGTKRTY